MVHFAGALRKWELTWYMTYTKKTPNEMKAKLKHQFLSFLKTPYANHLAAKKLITKIEKLTKTI